MGFPSRKYYKRFKRNNKYSRRKTQRGGTIQNDSTELAKLRYYSKQCADNVNVQNYIRDTTIKFIKLLNDMEFTIEDIKKRYVKGSKENPSDYGIVLEEDFVYTYNNGNVREKMSIIAMLCKCYREIFITLIIDNHNDKLLPGIAKDSKLINLIQTKLLTYFGLKNTEQLIEFFTTCRNDCGLDYASMSTSESIVPSRYTGYPMNPTRKPRNAAGVYALATHHIYPKLSCNEKKYLKTKYLETKDHQNNHTSTSNSTDCPDIYNIDNLIKSGAQYYTIDEDSSFYKLCHTYKHYMVAGPSGIADILFHVFGLFDDFNIDLFVLSCIAYMGNTPDHSIFEILLPAITYGIDYDSTLNEYDFIDTLLDTYKP